MPVHATVVSCRWPKLPRATRQDSHYMEEEVCPDEGAVRDSVGRISALELQTKDFMAETKKENDESGSKTKHTGAEKEKLELGLTGQESLEQCGQKRSIEKLVSHDTIQKCRAKGKPLTIMEVTRVPFCGEDAGNRGRRDIRRTGSFRAVQLILHVACGLQGLAPMQFQLRSSRMENGGNTGGGQRGMVRHQNGGTEERHGRI